MSILPIDLVASQVSEVSAPDSWHDRHTKHQLQSGRTYHMKILTPQNTATGSKIGCAWPLSGFQTLWHGLKLKNATGDIKEGILQERMGPTDSEVHYEPSAPKSQHDGRNMRSLRRCLDAIFHSCKTAPLNARSSAVLL